MPEKSSKSPAFPTCLLRAQCPRRSHKVPGTLYGASAIRSEGTVLATRILLEPTFNARNTEAYSE